MASTLSDDNNAIQEIEAGRLYARKQLLTNIVHDDANPSPFFVVGIALGVMVVLYCMYVILLKPNASGEWIDSDGAYWTFNHTSFGVIHATRNNDNLQCSLTDNMFKCGDSVGIWDYNDVIIMVDGSNLTRVH